MFLFSVKIFSIHNLEECDLKLEKAVLANAILTDRQVLMKEFETGFGINTKGVKDVNCAKKEKPFPIKTL